MKLKLTLRDVSPQGRQPQLSPIDTQAESTPKAADQESRDFNEEGFQELTII